MGKVEAIPQLREQKRPSSPPRGCGKGGLHQHRVGKPHRINWKTGRETEHPKIRSGRARRTVLTIINNMGQCPSDTSRNREGRPEVATQNCDPPQGDSSHVLVKRRTLDPFPPKVEFEFPLGLGRIERETGEIGPNVIKTTKERMGPREQAKIRELGPLHGRWVAPNYRGAQPSQSTDDQGVITERVLGVVDPHDFRPIVGLDREQPMGKPVADDGSNAPPSRCQPILSIDGTSRLVGQVDRERSLGGQTVREELGGAGIDNHPGGDNDRRETKPRRARGWNSQTRSGRLDASRHRWLDWSDRIHGERGGGRIG
jgi:hypothetical protein